MHSPSQFFPSVEDADDFGMVARGGELSSQRLVDAYRHGIFPWPNWMGVVEWCSPPVRAVFEFETFHISRSLARTLRRRRFEVTFDRDFRRVITACATADGRRRRTWITPPIVDAYCKLHAEGIAHSVEAWQNGQLAGGVYGVALGGMFAAESMFYRVADASKVALTCLTKHLQSRGYELFDIQQWTPNSATLGCRAITRDAFLARLAAALDKPATFGP
ncbi:MAG TPA: leucyl/phenylalanyl-tRNA--protein transferase [Pirellulales bacterium]|jgi:leucyl/phenylalanyl-tRNA--protein transferase|nr:leucyl/phenylalanyl-tRNA--protein transferase [Pirellulales bacterium]